MKDIQRLGYKSKNYHLWAFLSAFQTWRITFTPNDPEQRTKTNNLINLLLRSHILRHEGKGYQLNQSIVHPVRKWMLLRQPSEYQPNLKQLERVSRKFQEDYPAAKALYQRMLPQNLINAQHST